MTFPQKVKIVEVGPRDGLQNESHLLSVAEKVDFIDSLSDTGLQVIEAGAFVSTQRVPQMSESDQVYSTIYKKEGVSYPVLVPNLKGMERALKLEVKEISLFTTSSETFCQKNINCSIEESFNRFNHIFPLAQSYDIRVRGYVSCALGCPYEGDISIEKTFTICKRLVDMGCYEISLGDTIGVGTPLKVKRLLEKILKNIPSSKVAVHFHDTYGQALANILQSLQMGIHIIDSSVAGLGGCPYAQGASGNVATEDVLYMLEGLEIDSGVNLTKVAQIGYQITQKLGGLSRSKVAQALKAKEK